MKQAQYIGIIITTIVLTYLAVITNNYGFSDDYRHLYRAITEDPHFPDNIIVQGRPLYALLLDLLFSAIGSIEFLSIARALSVAGITLCGILLYKRYYSATQHHIQSTCLALLTVFTPAFGVYAAWASTFHAPYAALLAMASAYVIIENRSKCCWVVSWLLLLASLQLYQPTAMMFWLYIAIGIWGMGSISHEKQKQLIRSGVLFAAACIGFYLIHKLTVSYYVGQDSFFEQAASRSALTANIIEKMKWFITEPLMAAINLVYISESNLRAITITLILIIGLVLHEKRSAKEAIVKRIGYWTVITGLLIATFLPNLVIKLDIEVYRTLPALYGMILWFLYIAVKEIAHKKQQIVTAVAMLSVGLSIIAVRDQIDTYIIQPSIKEQNKLALAIEQQKDTRRVIKKIYVLNPARQRMINGEGYYEYGESASISMPWVTEGLVWLVARETLQEKWLGDIKIEVVTGQKSNGSRNSIIINVPEAYGSMQ